MKIVKILALVVFGFAALIVTILIGREVMDRLMYGDHNKIFAVYPDNRAPVVLVHGYTDMPLEDWSVSLMVKSEDDRWLIYYLDHKTSGREHYVLKRNGDELTVYQNEGPLAKFNFGTKQFFHIRQELTYPKPIAQIHNHDIDDYQKWSYWVDEKGERL